MLKHKAINEWRLFGLIAIPMCIAMVIAMMGVDLSTVSGVRSMIQFSVRCAVPFILMIVAAPAVQKLWPGPFPMWWLRNAKYIGLCFAVAMAWQGLFIFIMSNFFRDYYFEEVFLFRDELEGSTGYIFLTAMVVTSFTFGRKYLTPNQWTLLHRSAVYFLWAYIFAVYWWNLFSYENPLPIDHVYYWAGFLAFATRIAAWGKKRQQAAQKNSPASSTPLAFNVLGGALIAFGIFVAASGLYWIDPVSAFVFAPKWSADLYLWLPFWPFRPFYSLFIIGLGTTLMTRARTSASISLATPAL